MKIFKSNKLYLSMLVSFAILILLYYPSLGVALNYFHNDDLVLIGRLSNLTDFHSAINFVFSFDSLKFRPIANLLYLIEYFIFTDRYNSYILFNIGLILIVNYIFLLFIYEKESLLVCLVLSLVLVSSKFFTYSVWNITGSFESLAAIFFLLIIFSIYSNGRVGGKTLVFLSLLLILTSERYLPFIVALPIIHYFNYSEKNFFTSTLFKVKYAIAIAITYFAFRYFSGIPLIVGTQTDNVVESFSGVQFLLHIAKSYSEIFGFSIGPKYLTGFEFVDWVPFNVLIKDSIYIRGFFLGLSLSAISLYYFLFKSCTKEKTIFLFNLIGFVLILAASITFRLELRWLLPSYLMLLLIFSIHSSFDKCDGSHFNVRLFDRMLFVSVISLSLLNNIYYAIYLRRSLYFAEKLHDASFVVFFGRCCN